jgi:hypothetical protein
MTKMTDMSAAFSGGTIMSLGRVQISRFAAVLMRLRRAVIRRHVAVAALLTLGTIVSGSPSRADPATAEIAAAQPSSLALRMADRPNISGNGADVGIR